MPRGDRTGPEGMGPMTGRAMGYCAGADSPGFVSGTPAYVGRGYGRGFGRGGGYGRGRGARFYGTAPAAPVSPVSKEEIQKTQLTELKNLANSLENDLEIVKKKIEDLSAE
ncbi:MULTISPECIES: DUF5320 domain-containing protein [unclassified Halanaerobium]|uniref:DUF5320 domain-containing protein n=1 Tax=unclassified Halanaerobium TaxID=2641197 RepID=UPI000DF1BCF4|nr:MULTISPECIES: DUF5320 domain-containing protein [unclassified Halanaerobium]RCW48754.1 hypothetical protein DFR78_10735 [Halanaerobium sp. MA284_MarDTE_T2]RCW89096.1 hypothetical protein DER71_10236 [Halanaerobium sp. DL-01]